MLKHGIGGSLRAECRTNWQKDILDQVKHNTMLSESTLAAVKALRRQLGDAGAKARVNHRMSKFWEVYGEMLPQEREVADLLVSKFRSKLKVYDAETQALADVECIVRANRRMDDEVKKAAAKYADRLQLVRAKPGLWQPSEVDAKLKDKWKTAGAKSETQDKLLQEQLEIIVDGWGHKDMAVPAQKERGSGHRCKCGCAFGNGHLKKHVKWALTEIHGRWHKAGGKPDKPPPPSMALQSMPASLRANQAENPIYGHLAEMEHRAERLVRTKQVESSIVLLDEMTLPEINLALVGKDVEYRCLAADEGEKRRSKKHYYGTIQSVNLHDMKGRKPMASAVVKWDVKGGEVSSMWLDTDMYCHMDMDGGWAIVEDGEDGDPVEAIEETVAEFFQAKLEAEYLLVEMEK